MPARINAGNIHTMAKYDYRCSECGEFEYEQPMSAPNLEECPDCGSTVKKLFRPPSMTGFPNGPKNTAPVYNPSRSPIWNSAQAE